MELFNRPQITSFVRGLFPGFETRIILKFRNRDGNIHKDVSRSESQSRHANSDVGVHCRKGCINASIDISRDTEPQRLPRGCQTKSPQSVVAGQMGCEKVMAERIVADGFVCIFERVLDPRPVKSPFLLAARLSSDPPPLMGDNSTDGRC